MLSTESDGEGVLIERGVSRDVPSDGEDIAPSPYVLNFKICLPSQTNFKCLICDVRYTTLASLRRHVKTSHGLYKLKEIFVCDDCGKKTDTLKAFNAHHHKAEHGTAQATTNTEGAFRCKYCPLCFFSKKSHGQHVRNSHMDEACVERAAANNDGKRRLWDSDEIVKFKVALKRLGPSSNVEIAKAICTRTCKQVGVFKHAFLLKNPTWLVDNNATQDVNASPPSQPSSPGLHTLPPAANHTGPDSNSNLNLTATSPLSSPSPYVYVSSAAQLPLSSPSPHLNVSHPSVFSTPPNSSGVSSAVHLPFSSPPPHLNVSLTDEVSDVASAFNAPGSCILSPQRALSATPVASPSLQLRIACTDAPVISPNAGASVDCPRSRNTLSVTAQPFVPTLILPSVSSPAPVQPVTPLPPCVSSIPQPYYHPSAECNTPEAQVNSTLREPFLNDVHRFTTRPLDAAAWCEFEQVLLHWVTQIQMATDTRQPTSASMHTATRQYASRRRRRLRATTQSSPSIPVAPDTILPTISEPLTTETAPSQHNLPQSISQRSGRHRLAEQYRAFQRLYRQNPGACMKNILNDKPPCYCAILDEELTVHFTTSYAAAVPLPPTPNWLLLREPSADIMGSIITPHEVQMQLKRAKRSAPGSDGITYATWKWVDPLGAILATIFDICRQAKQIPADWKKSTVMLIHKGGDESSVRNWRPISLQKTIYKLYSALIARRIADWAISNSAFSPAQKGFLPFDGCAEQNFIIRSVLTNSRRAKKDLMLAWLDLRDAFGSVPHELLILMMRRLGLDNDTTDIVRDIYSGSTIAVRTGKSSYTADIPQARGVKQGCPLSPILFNIALEGLLQLLADSGLGYPISPLSGLCG